MTIFFPWALVLSIILAGLTFFACLLQKKRLIIFLMVAAALMAVPITSFTRGAHGAIVPSDIVSLVLVGCLVLTPVRRVLDRRIPRWYPYFLLYTLVCIMSALFVAPLYMDVGGGGFVENVRISDLVVPVEILMALFHALRVLLLLPYFVYAIGIRLNPLEVRSVLVFVWLGVLVMGLLRLLGYYGIVDTGFYLPFQEYQVGRTLGWSKAATTRLLLIGAFISLLLLARSRFSPPFLLGGAFLVGVIFLTGGRAATLGFALGCVVLVIGARRVSHLATVAVFSGIILVLVAAALHTGYAASLDRVIGEPLSNTRWLVWDWTLSFLLHNPITLVTGVGAMNYSYALTARGAVLEHAHNDLLAVLAELGLPGLFVFIAYLNGIRRVIWRRMKSTPGPLHWEAVSAAAMFVALFLAGMFESSFAITVGGVSRYRLIAVVLGVLTASWARTPNCVSDYGPRVRRPPSGDTESRQRTPAKYRDLGRGPRGSEACQSR